MQTDRHLFVFRRPKATAQVQKSYRFFGNVEQTPFCKRETKKERNRTVIVDPPLFPIKKD
jgi:hypothetical protein